MGQKATTTRPPVFILVCANTRWRRWSTTGSRGRSRRRHSAAGHRRASERDGRINTIRVDSKVVEETDSRRREVGRGAVDALHARHGREDATGRAIGQGRPIYPEGFEELAAKRGAPLHPPGPRHPLHRLGRHAHRRLGLQHCHAHRRAAAVHVAAAVRAGRRARPAAAHATRSTRTGCIDGGSREGVRRAVPGDPVQGEPAGTAAPARAAASRARAAGDAPTSRSRFRESRATFQAIRNRVTVDWTSIAPAVPRPGKIPPEVEVKASLPTNTGRPSLLGPGRIVRVDLSPFRQGRRDAVARVRDGCGPDADVRRGRRVRGAGARAVPAARCDIVQRYIKEKVDADPAGAARRSCSCRRTTGWAIERLSEAIRPDTSQGEAPEVPRYEPSREAGSSADVDFPTTRDVREVLKSHVNYVVADTKRWEQSAAYILDTHPEVEAFVKNAGLGFASPISTTARSTSSSPTSSSGSRIARRFIWFSKRRGSIRGWM